MQIEFWHDFIAINLGAQKKLPILSSERSYKWNRRLERLRRRFHWHGTEWKVLLLKTIFLAEVDNNNAKWVLASQHALSINLLLRFNVYKKTVTQKYKRQPVKLEWRTVGDKSWNVCRMQLRRDRKSKPNRNEHNSNQTTPAGFTSSYFRSASSAMYLASFSCSSNWLRRSSIAYDFVSSSLRELSGRGGLSRVNKRMKNSRHLNTDATSREARRGGKQQKF